MNEIGSRMRSVSRSEIDYKLTKDMQAAKVFCRSAAALENCGNKLISNLDASLKSARVQTEKSLSLRLLGGLVQIAGRYIKSRSPPLSPQQLTTIACQRYVQKFCGKHPDFSEVLNNRATDTESFQIVMNVLKGTTTGNTFACMADINDFKKKPSLEFAKMITDKYISDQKNDAVLDAGSTASKFGDVKHMSVNLYRSTYLEFRSALVNASFAVALGDEDAGMKLEKCFNTVIPTLTQDLRNVRNTIDAVIRENQSISRFMP